MCFFAGQTGHLDLQSSVRAHKLSFLPSLLSKLTLPFSFVPPASIFFSQTCSHLPLHPHPENSHPTSLLLQLAAVGNRRLSNPALFSDLRPSSFPGRSSSDPAVRDSGVGGYPRRDGSVQGCGSDLAGGGMLGRK